MSWIPSIGLEVHVQLKTQSKMFCGCSTRFGAPPNTQVCPVCLGYPGALPVINGEAIRLTVMSGLMLGCTINLRSKFDRKNYFYPDMAKNYQISQYDQPLCLGGGVEIDLEGVRKRVGLTRIHLEEDVAKNTHLADGSGIDFNRAGTPLMEIVSEPDLASAEEAMAFLQALRQMLVYGGISDANLEEGNLRCDVNCSVRPEGRQQLGTKIEIKNMNTFKGVFRALKHELPRQVRELERGRALVQETRRWDDAAGATESMRSKEQAHDYRYFPEPDLLPVVLADEQVAAWKAMLPELPAQRRERLVAAYGLPAYDADVLVAERDVADFFEDVVRRCGHAKAASNWVMTEVLRIKAERGVALSSLPLTAAGLAGLIDLVEKRAINMPSAKEVFAELVEKGGDPAAIVQARGMAQVSDDGALEEFVGQALAGNPKSVADYRAGKQAALKFLMGQVMKFSKGKADPRRVQDILQQKLDG